MIKAINRLILFSLFWVYTSVLCAQIPAGYYDTAKSLSGTDLQQALHDIIDYHIVSTYTELWTHFESTDSKGDGTVWDMYSDLPGGTPAYIYYFVQNQCGNYTSEGDCFNREHSFPKSWFGGEIAPMYTDLFHLYPTDGWVNNKRGNYPFGVTSSPIWTSTNGSRLGPSSKYGYTGTVFEPIDEYKGDLARTYFYMAVRYYGEDTTWPGSDMVTGSQPKPWALSMLMEWDQADPVSQKELDRNEAVYLIQGNRNPFIDNPSYSALIWGTANGLNDNLYLNKTARVWPNPANDFITIELPVYSTGTYELKILDVTGRIVSDRVVSCQQVTLDISDIAPGYYILFVKNDSDTLVTRIIISR